MLPQGSSPVNDRITYCQKDSFPELSPSETTADQQRAKHLGGGEQPTRVTRTNKKASLSFCYGQSGATQSQMPRALPALAKGKKTNPKLDERDFLRKPSSKRLLDLLPSKDTKEKLRAGSLKMIHDVPKTKKFDEDLTKSIKTAVDKAKLSNLDKNKTIERFSECIGNWCCKEMEEKDLSLLLTKDVFNLMGAEEELAVKFQERLKKNPILFEQQYETLKLLYDVVLAFIEKRGEHSQASFELYLGLEALLNVFTIEENLRDSAPEEDVMQTYTERLKKCLGNSVFGKQLHYAFGGYDNTKEFINQIDEIRGPIGLSLIKEQIHTIHWAWLKTLNTCSKTYSWEGGNDVKPPLGEIALNEIKRCLVPNESSNVLFDQIIVDNDALSLDKKQFPFFKYLLEKVYLTGFFGTFSAGQLEKQAKKILKHEKIPASDVLRLATLGSWSRCDKRIKEYWPRLFDNDFTRSNKENRLDIEIVSGNKQIVTQQKKYLFYTYKDKQGMPITDKRHVCTINVAQKIFLKKSSGKNHYSGEIFVSFPEFEDVSFEEKIDILKRFG